MTYRAQDDTAEWLNYLQPEGLVVGPNVLRERGLTPIRQTPLDTEAAATALRLSANASPEDDHAFTLGDPWSFFQTILEWPARLVAGAPGGPAVDPALTVTVPEHETLLSPDLALLWNGPASEDLPAQALVMLHPDLDPDDRNQFAAGEWEVSPHQRLERLLRETNIGVGILVARSTLRLIYAPRGETAGWMSWPLAALGRVEGRPMLAGLKLCLGRNAFFTGAVETRLRALLRASREAQDKVSERLSGQVLGALHELLRGLHRAAPDRIEALADSDPHHLYEGLLTCLMRLVFLLYAEDRDLLPSASDPRLRALWESGYSIKTLYQRLLVDEALNPDTMDERRGGWGQLLAVFRVVHDGADGWVARRGGKLFDPERFAFLEGRSQGSARDAAEIMPVSDGCILRILHGLMTIEGRTLSGAKTRERLSYRSLDVESIGSVYETVMGFTASRATERMIALKDEKKLPTFVPLDSLLKQKPADRQKWLKERSIKLSAKQAKGVKEAGDVAAFIEAFGSLVDERASPDAAPIGAGAPYLQPTEERRRSGSHYTPRSLTEPIVRHALEPAFARLGPSASPEEVLSLKVLDPACGSGAFLVEACRQLGARLEQAWNMYGAEKPVIPPDEDEALHARRLVAQKCLYGVDRNHMAVDLARLSLWLATLAREHEFTFLDHALKEGDSLVGLTRDDIAAAHWDSSKPGLPLFGKMIRESVDRAREIREAIRNASDDVHLEAQAARYARVLDTSEPARIVGDAVIAAFFSADKAKARETERQTVESWITGSLNPDWDRLKANADAFHAAHGWRPFHWEIEFPEVFSRENPGFDAVVGNPPFLAGSEISSALGTDYLKWLQFRLGLKGQADLVAGFFLQAFKLVRAGGAFGLISTQTIARGDTRSCALERITLDDGHIYRAIKRFIWPGLASVTTSVVWIIRGLQPTIAHLDGVEHLRLTSFLLPTGPNTSPGRLAENKNLSFEGVKYTGQGFLFSADGGDTTDYGEMHRLLRSDPRNAEIIRPLMRGESFLERPDLSPDRYIIDFNDRSEIDARNWPDLMSILEQNVRPYRTSSDKSESRPWWQFARPRPALRAATRGLDRVLMRPKISVHNVFAFVPVDVLISAPHVAIALDRGAAFATLQCRVHELWTVSFGALLDARFCYTPSDCFETFPFPQNYETDAALEAAGQIYHDHRGALMVAADEGMTKTYNRFHRSDETSEPIRRLRDLHDEMDHAVLRAYGWHDLAEDLRPQFLTEDTEDDHTYQGRYFWPAEARERVLARLLALNAERYEEEVAAGLVRETAPARRGREDEEDAAQGDLSLG